MKTYISAFTLVLISLTIGCRQSKDYEVIKTNDNHYNTQFKVLLPNEKPIVELEMIYEELKGSNNKGKNLFVFFYLPNMDTSSVAWATGTFIPSMGEDDVEIVQKDN